METSKASFSIASIVAIIAAILSFKFGAILGLIFAAVAFVCGALGIILALGPNTRGGGLSILAVILSFVGVIAAIIKAVIWLLSLG
ncbi:hypothetical protein HZ994_00640 [Akkermansiaceae bacterium]|nr:hypothetical protein HZ994_00640 [Akkermansiaceae bacterium]